MDDDKFQIFKNLDNFKDSDLFCVFLYFKFLKNLGPSIIEKFKLCGGLNRVSVQGKYYHNNGNPYFIIDDFHDFSTYVFSKVVFNNKEFSLCVKDEIDNNRIILCSYTTQKYKSILNLNNNGKIFNFYVSKENLARDPKFKKLMELMFKYNNLERKYHNKIKIFEKYIKLEPEFRTDKRSFLDKDYSYECSNRIDFTNLKKGQVYFIQGPPGTGKTTTIANLIVENNKSRLREDGSFSFDTIIICSMLHSAINNAIERTLDDKSDFTNNFYDEFQLNTVLYSNRRKEKVKDSSKSILLNIGNINDDDSYLDYKEVFDKRVINNGVNLNNFTSYLDKIYDNRNIDMLNSNPLENLIINYKNNDLSYKFMEYFSISNTKRCDNDINYCEDINNMISLYNDYNTFINNSFNTDWALKNYVDALKDNANIIFSTLDSLDKTLDNIVASSNKNILIVIDEASKSTILHYLTLLDNIDNYTLLVIGDPNQLNAPLVFSNDIKFYSNIMSKFEMKLKDCENKIFSSIYSTSRFNRLKLINIFEEITMDILKNYDTVNTDKWEAIFKNNFFEDLFYFANDERKERFSVHRRSCQKIFNITSPLYNLPNEDIWYSCLWDTRKQNDAINKGINVNGHKEVELYDNIEDFDLLKFRIKNILSKLIFNKDVKIGVISFYNKNLLEIKKYCFDISSNIYFSSVDSSQGMEYDILLLDLSPECDNNTSDYLSSFFCKDFQRLNVAISRAVYQLFVFRTKRFNYCYNNSIEKFSNDNDFLKFKTIVDGIEKEAVIINE